MMREGSVITIDNGVQALAQAASRGEKYSEALFPFLLNHLKACRPKDVPQHAEKALAAVSASQAPQFVAVLKKRMGELSGSGTARLKKVIKQAEAMA
jgi:hypothetical protein